MLSLQYLIENSGDSILDNYTYSGGILAINLCLGDSDKKVLIEIKTDVMSFRNYYLDKIEEMHRTCRIEIQELSNNLSIENGIYLPSNIFGKFMNEKKLNYHLAYGEKVNSMKFIFSLVGYDRLISCLISDESCIKIKEMNNR